MSYPRQYWTDEGLKTMMLKRVDWEEDFERVISQGGKGKKREQGYETQNSLWDAMASQLKTEFPELTFVKNSQDEPQEMSGEQCSNKFYNVHGRIRSLGEQVETKGRDLPDYLLIPKILFHLLSHTRTGGVVIEKDAVPPIHKSKPGTKAVLKYVKEVNCPDTSWHEIQPISQGLAKKLVQQTLYIKDEIFRSGLLPELDTEEEWRNLIESLKVDLSQTTLVSHQDVQAAGQKRTHSTATGSSQSKSKARRSTTTVRQRDDASVFTSDSEAEDELRNIEEKIPPMSAPNSVLPQITPQGLMHDESFLSSRPRSIPNGTPGRIGGSISRARSERIPNRNMPMFLIFEDNPFSRVVAKKDASVYNVSDKTWEGISEDEAAFAYPIEPHKRLADVLLYLMKEQQLTEREQDLLSIAHVALGFEKYRPIVLSTAQLACPDNHYMNVETFIRLLEDKLKQLSLSMQRLSAELSRVQ